MNVAQVQAWCGSHHYGWVPVGVMLVDDGFGNAVAANTLAALYFIQGE